MTRSGTLRIRSEDASSSIDNQIKAAGLSGLNDPSIKQSIMSNISYAQNAGKNPQDIIDAILNKNKQRLDNAPNSTYTPNGSGGSMGTGGTTTAACSRPARPRRVSLPTGTCAPAA